MPTQPRNSTRNSVAATVTAFVVGQTVQNVAPEGAVTIKTAKSLPTYSAVLPKYKILAEERVKKGGLNIRLRVKAYPPENFLVEASVDVPHVFDMALDTLRDQLLETAEARLRKLKTLEQFKEEYTIFAVSGYAGEPRQFLKYEREIVGLIRSENLPLSVGEIEETIKTSSLQYTAHDLTILDWDGAFVFDPKGDWHETIDLIEVANVHLLRLRVLDQDLDRRLSSMASLLESMPKRNMFTGGRVRKQMAELMSLQVRSIKEFSHSGRDIQLIGDWYLAKLYALISKKFHLSEWRASLRNELNNLHDLYDTAAEHFGISNQTRAEFIEISLWLVLAVGYFVLFFLDAQKVVGG